MSDGEWLDGKHAVVAALQGAARRVHEVWVRTGAEPESIGAAVAVAGETGTRLVRVDAEAMRDATGFPAAVAAHCQSFGYRTQHELPASPPGGGLIVVLDQIQDPQNLGAIIRTAEAAGALALCIPQDRSAMVTPAVVRASAGASESLPIHRVVNVARLLPFLAERGYWSVGLAPGAPAPWYEVDLTGGIALVVGAEGAGLRRLVAARCDTLVALPMAGKTESLNASAAFAAMAYEVVRQRAVARGPGR